MQVVFGKKILLLFLIFFFESKLICKLKIFEKLLNKK